MNSPGLTGTPSADCASAWVINLHGFIVYASPSATAGRPPKHSRTQAAITASATAPGATGLVQYFILSRTEFQVESRLAEHVFCGGFQSTMNRDWARAKLRL